ncbi:hypothetical protein B0H14DRAFT_3424278 [Mycena olivaceomarginata]|nr:hypothetical protein B0H14DRAFT_3424278 [Mycena olivaceomarginata]
MHPRHSSLWSNGYDSVALPSTPLFLDLPCQLFGPIIQSIQPNHSLAFGLNVEASEFFAHRSTELMKQALAAERFSCGPDVDHDEEDCDDAALALEAHVKKLALDDWARARVLDGVWLAPLDACYVSGDVNPIDAAHQPPPPLAT